MQDTELLVGLGKSKRLMAMRESQAMRPASTPVKKNQTFVVNKRDAEIKQARDLSGSRYFCESLFWASQPKQAAKT
ncbi:hypothetical protein BMR04_12045 [Methylococcaceae bacterium HT3]|nr:hypothetical protein BMR04_12045 [Methylococcaceae bacterium HT3]TXL22341.1 hypothetical protein BMR03_08800 [Methylococcaceae bacterium HT2]